MGPSRRAEDQGYLARLAAGGGIQASRLEQLYLFGPQSEIEIPADLVSYSGNLLNAQGHKVLKKG